LGSTIGGLSNVLPMKHRKDIGKAPNCFLKVMKNIKKDIMGAKNIIVLVSENSISYFRINGNKRFHGQSI
jgi:hypothetical protein